VKIKKKYCGVVIPLITPFIEEMVIDQKATSTIINYVIESDTIPFILGTTGESASIPYEFKLDFVKKVVDSVQGRSLIYAGISDTCISNSINLAHQFAEAGVDVFVLHPASYYPLTLNQLFSYYYDLAETVPAPLMIYNIPATTNVSIPTEIIEELSHHPNIIGLKDSERSLDRMHILVKQFANRLDFSILSGWTNQSAYALLSGFDGIVPSTGNIIPKVFSELYQAALNDDVKTTQRLQNLIDPVADFHQKDRKLGETIAILKLMMSRSQLCRPVVLPPLTRLSKEEEKRLIEAMPQLNVEIPV
jgi:4-hydroxy-tetrahydrodipicolinate synthase